MVRGVVCPRLVDVATAANARGGNGGGGGGGGSGSGGGGGGGGGGEMLGVGAEIFVNPLLYVCLCWLCWLWASMLHVALRIVQYGDLILTTSQQSSQLRGMNTITKRRFMTHTMITSQSNSGTPYIWLVVRWKQTLRIRAVEGKRIPMIATHMLQLILREKEWSKNHVRV